MAWHGSSSVHGRATANVTANANANSELLKQEPELESASRL